MKYMGSKNRIAKEILPIILYNRKPNQWYVEPFVGGANMIDKVTGDRLGGDSNRYLIDALNVIMDNPEWLPTSFSEDEYASIKNHKETHCSGWLGGYVGFALSYGGKWFGGYCRDKEGKRNYIMEAYRSAQKQSINLKGCIFEHASYLDLDIPDNSIIYCDPPYEGTTKYKDNFNHASFWEWCRNMHDKGHLIYISEYNAPEDFNCVWHKEQVSSLTKNTGEKKAVEKLFTIAHTKGGKK